MPSHLRLERRTQHRSPETDQERTVIDKKHVHTKEVEAHEHDRQDAIHKEVTELDEASIETLDQIDDVLADNKIYLPLGNVAVSAA